MASDIFAAMGNQPAHAQNPKDQALAILKQRGISVPDSIAGNPQAIIQHLMQSGAIPQNRLAMAQQMMQRMFRK